MITASVANGETNGIGQFRLDQPLSIALVYVPPANSLCHRAEPLGLMALKGQVLRLRDDAHVSILDQQIESGDSIADRLLAQSPDVIGFSLFPGSRREANAILARVLAQRTGRPPLLVFGNADAMFSFEDILKEHPGSLVVRGEGEDAMQGIVEALYGMRRLDTVPNIVRLAGDSLVHNVRRRVDLDKVAPPSRDDSLRYIRTGILSLLETGRGCRHACTFCTRAVFFGEHRRREFPIERIMSDLETLSGLGADGINIVDDDFFQAGPAKLKQMALQIIESKARGRITGKLQLVASLRADDLWSARASDDENKLNKQVLELMDKAGLVWVCMGVESGSPTQLERYGKTLSLVEIRNAVTMLESLGIGIDANIILFDPHVSFPELKETIAFLRETGLWKYVVEPFSVVYAVQGSALTERLQSCGLLDAGYDRERQLYPFVFRDERIALVVQLLYAWREPFRKLNAALRRAYRGEMWCGRCHDPGARRIYNHTVQSRGVFLDMLERSIDIVEHGKGAEECRAAFNAGNRDLRTIAASLVNEFGSGMITDGSGRLKTIVTEFIEKCPAEMPASAP